MTTEQIRKSVKVCGYSLSVLGIYITYQSWFTNSSPEVQHYQLDPLQSVIALERIGAISKFEVNPIRVWWDTAKGTPVNGVWTDFRSTFVLSQFDAISLIVRHEYEKSLEGDMHLLEIDAALEALKH